MVKNWNGDWRWRKTTLHHQIIPFPQADSSLGGGSFTLSSSFSECSASDNSASFLQHRSHHLSLPLSLCFWRHGHPPSGSDSSGVTTLRGVECTVMPLNLPLGNLSRGGGLSSGPIQKRPIWKVAKPSPRRSEGCLQNNSLLSAVCFPEESPPQTDNSLQMGTRVWPIGV